MQWATSIKAGGACLVNAMVLSKCISQLKGILGGENKALQDASKYGDVPYLLFAQIQGYKQIQVLPQNFY